MIEAICSSETYELTRIFQLLDTVNVVPNFLIVSTLMMEAIRSSETLVLARAARGVASQKTIFFKRRFVTNYPQYKQNNMAAPKYSVMLSSFMSKSSPNLPLN
jgi:hypothetical protein